MSDTDIRVGMNHFASSVYNDFELGDYNTVADVQVAVRSSAYTGGSTRTDMGIDRLTEKLLARYANLITGLLVVD